MRTVFPTRQTVSSAGVTRRSRWFGNANSETGRGTGDVLRSRRLDLTDAIELEATAAVGGHRVAADDVPLMRFVAGIDAAAEPMSTDEVRHLGDPFSRGVLLNGRTPKTVRELFDAVASIDEPALTLTQVFLIAEGGQARLKSPNFELNARLVVTWQVATAAAGPSIMLSTVAAADDPEALMQLIAWSEADEAFHFFERERLTGNWVWAGNSFHALDSRSRGKGPFDSHVNGGLVMKELKAPWTHWHSVSASIAPEAIPPASELLSEPMFRPIESAHVLEPMVKTGVRRWTRSRMRRSTENGRLRDVPAYLKQLLWCTSVNLISSTRVFGQPEDGVYPLPTSFFVDFDALAFLSDELAPSEPLLPAARLNVPADLYEYALTAAGVGVVEDGGDGTRQEGDTHFAFLVPERAFEDFVVLQQLVLAGALSARTALCLLLIDFQNPVFSPDRAALLAHGPADVALDGGSDFDAQLRHSIGDPAPGSVQARFLSFLDDADLTTTARKMIADFFATVQTRLQTRDGVDDLVKLADSRRRTFASRKLAEFRSTLAVGANPVAHLAMALDGTLLVKETDFGEGER